MHSSLPTQWSINCVVVLAIVALQAEDPLDEVKESVKTLQVSLEERLDYLEDQFSNFVENS